jgi:hypothetical protein
MAQRIFFNPVPEILSNEEAIAVLLQAVARIMNEPTNWHNRSTMDRFCGLMFVGRLPKPR